MSVRIRRTHALAFAALACSTLMLAPSPASADLNQVQQGFAAPPNDARIMTRWWWYGPSVVKTELEAEMKFMKEGGFGGFEVQNTYPLALDNPAAGIKNIDFLSKENLDNLAFVAAKAKELGLRMDLTLGSGWPYGGPMFSIDENSGKIESQTVALTGVVRSVAIPALRDGQKLIAAFAWDDAAGAKKYVEIKAGAASGVFEIPVSIGKPTQALFVIAGHTLMKVKRPSVGAEGNVIDHLSAAVVEKFISEIAEKQIKACGPNPPYAVFCDSLEVAQENWSDNILGEFQKRRGYDLRPHLPSLVVNAGPESLEIRRDWGLTLAEVFNDNFMARFTKLAHDNGTKFRMQAYGSPANMISSYETLDLPEGEGPQWRSLSSTRWATSASHMLGRPVTSSETFTWLHSPVFRATPLDMKVEADLHFLQGINQLICHGWPYTPPGVEYPGWRFYAAGVFNEKNPWWIVMPDVTKYLQRTSYLLRQGAPANDVAIYLPTDDAFSRFGPGVDLRQILAQNVDGQLIGGLLAAGYNMDCFDDALLAKHGKIEGKELAFENSRYRAVILPGVERIPLVTLNRFAAFAKAGGTVIALRTLPSKAPGFMATEVEQKQLATAVESLFRAQGAPGVFVEQDENLIAALGKSLKPDMICEPASPEIGFLHRRLDDSEIYFVANTSNVEKHVTATFRLAGSGVELWDPMSGKSSPAALGAAGDGVTAVKLDLAPYGSTFVTFSKRAAAPSPEVASTVPKGSLDLAGGWNVAFGKEAKPVAMEKLHSWTDDEATRFFSGVATYEKIVKVPNEMVAEGVRVNLDFGSTSATTAQRGAGRAGRAAGAAPADAGTRGGRGARGGGARGGGGGNPGRPTAQIEVPVREAAVVYINDQRVGSVWHPPYRLDVTEALKVGQNKIRIEVANLALNYMAGHPLPDYTELIAKYGDRFQPQEMNLVQPIPSGLLGPLQLTAAGR